MISKKDRGRLKQIGPIGRQVLSYLAQTPDEWKSEQEIGRRATNFWWNMKHLERSKFVEYRRDRQPIPSAPSHARTTHLYKITPRGLRLVEVGALDVIAGLERMD